VPIVDAATVLRDPDQFRVASGAAIAWLRNDRVSPVPNGWRARLGFPFEAIAGSAAALREYGRRLNRGEEWLPLRCLRVIVRSTPITGLLSDVDRDILWAAFELPVFEHLIGVEGERLAWECDAHYGLHLAEDQGIFESFEDELVVTSLAAVNFPVLRLRTGLRGVINRQTCDCGQPGARFLLSESVPSTGGGAGLR
jgi:phenylacetate-coenzyme A ligase PaaK-like adenylate-forming protein